MQTPLDQIWPQAPNCHTPQTRILWLTAHYDSGYRDVSLEPWMLLEFAVCQLNITTMSSGLTT
ncbi:MAG: hypothetical protein AAGD09_17725 [Cyanobacteria bacterium P01_F01_bin.56]